MSRVEVPPVRVLIVEDSDADTELVVRELRAGGVVCHHERVDTRAGWEDALTHPSSWDIVLLDHALPGLNTLELLAELREDAPDLPAIVVSGTITEESAVSALRAGARDFVTKQNLARLVPAVLREVAAAADVREHRIAEAALGESEARFARLVENAQDIVMSYRLKPPAFDYVSPSVHTILGYLPEDFYADPNLGMRMVHPDDRDALMSAYAADPERPVTGRAVAADGRVVWLDRRQVAIRDARGEIVGLEVVARDVTEQVHTLEQVQMKERKFRAIFDGALDALLLADDDRIYVDANPAACDLLGLLRDEIVGRRIEDFSDSTAAAEVVTRWAALLSEGRQEGEFVLLRPDGESRVTEFRATANVKPGVHLSILRDITALKASAEALGASEERLRRAQKMEAIGQLAGGIAHDFNNLLTVINGYSDIALGNCDGNEKLRHSVTEIRRAGDRAAELTYQLLAFSRQQVLKPEVLDLNRVVSDHASMLSRLLGDDIQLEVTLDAHEGYVQADPGQLAQVILNLAANARDAMPNGGGLTIRTDLLHLAEPDPTRGIAAGSYIVLQVSDTGSGINPETQARVFEPFFTTKDVGQGTGLGLSTVLGIVQQSRGHIVIDSEIARGTSFRIYLPRIEAPPIVPTAVEHHHGVETETVLLVEDDDIVRSLIEDILVERGYTVLTAATPNAALATAATYADEIQLLVTDVVMPEMNGRQLAELIQDLRPNVRTLYMSGYTDDIVIARGVLPAGTLFLQKPFTATQLAAKAREALKQLSV